MNATYCNESLVNSTILEHAPKLTSVRYIRVIVLITMAVISFIANAVTIWAAEKNRRKSKGVSAIHTLILHLAIADLLVTFFCIAGEALWTYTVAWLWDDITCKIFKYSQMFSLYLSTFVMVLIGFDRFLAVRFPLKSVITTKRRSGSIILVWVLSSLVSIPQLIIFRVARGPFVEDFMQCVTFGFYTAAWQEQLYTSLTLLILFIVPLIAFITTYVSTVITISRNVTSFRNQFTIYGDTNQDIGNVNRKRLMERAKNKSLRISIVIITTFVFWWTPYHILMMICMFMNPDDLLSRQLQDSIFFFGMSNSLVNPLIYGAFHLWPRKKTRQSVAAKGVMTMRERSATTRSSYMQSTRTSNNHLLDTQHGNIEMVSQKNTYQIEATNLIPVGDISHNNVEKLIGTSEKINLQYQTDFTIHETKIS